MIRSGMKVELTGGEIGIVANRHPNQPGKWFVMSKGNGYTMSEEDLRTKVFTQTHDNRYSYNEDENQAGITHCSKCGKITNHPIEEAIEAKVGDRCRG